MSGLRLPHSTASRRLAIVEHALALLGSAYSNCGRGPHTFDSLGVVWSCLAAGGVDVHFPRRYDPRTLGGGSARAALLDAGMKLRRPEHAIPGDIVRFGGEQSHLWGYPGSQSFAVFIGPERGLGHGSRTMVHAYWGRHVTRTWITEWWLRRAEAVYALPGGVAPAITKQEAA